MRTFILLVAVLGILPHAARCTPFEPYGFIPPRGIHLAFTGNPQEMVVSWLTTLPTNGSLVQVYRIVDGDLEFHGVFEGNMSTYLPSAGWNHHTLVTGLQPSSEYNYTCGSAFGFSPFFTFRTAPPQGAATATTPSSRFLMYGDMGIVNSHETVLAITDRVESEQIDFIYHAGDFGYGDDRPAIYYDMSWDVFFDNMQYVMPFIPYMVCVGNHETECLHNECQYYSKNFTAFNTRFRMPGAESGGAQNMFFSWNFQNIHFVSLSSETDYLFAPKDGPGYEFGNQEKWLRDDLTANAQNELTDWIIVVAHRPMYVTYNGDGTGESGGVPVDNARDLQRAFEEIFHEFGVDLYMDGHIHAYERQYPIYQSKKCGAHNSSVYVDPECTTYVVAGAAGNIEGHYTTSWDPNPPDWTAFMNDEYFGYAKVEVKGKSRLMWEWHRATDDAIMDEFQIIRT